MIELPFFCNLNVYRTGIFWYNGNVNQGLHRFTVKPILTNLEGREMKSIGIVRKIDELGRIVLPIETRRQLGLDAKGGVEIFVDEDRIILKKYEPCCLFCGDGDNVVVFRDKKVCKKCLEEMQQKL